MVAANDHADDGAGNGAARTAETESSSEERLRIRPNTWTKAVSDEDVIAEIQRVAALPNGSPLTGPFYDSRRSPESIGAARIIQRFGSWTKACHIAGVEVEERTRVYRKVWGEEEVLEWARRYLRESEARPTFMDFQFWLRRLKDEGAPSAATVRNRLGTWSNIVERAQEK